MARFCSQGNARRLLRLANMMVERWTRYRDAVMAAIIEAGKITSNKIG